MEAVIFMFCLTLHNIEEALWLTDWRKENMPNIRRAPEKAHFIFAAFGITVLGYLTGGLYLLLPESKCFEYAFIGFVGAMLINAVAPHLILSIVYKKFCPGVFTGCFLIMPFHILILLNALKGTLTITEMLVSVAVVGLILLGSIPILESIAKTILNKGRK